MLRLFFSYMLMLAAMTFNAMIVVCIVLGLGIGYFALGFDEIRFDLSNDGKLYHASEIENRMS